jgi:hypothetical protein
MALIDLKTNLKSLKYGSDRPGGGSSGQPYIQTDIPPTNLISGNNETFGGAGNTDPIYKINTTGNLDYPIRGGAINFQLGNQTFTLSSQIDKSRIRKFFEDAPRGKAFIDKQVGLQLSNPKIETGNTLVGFNQSNPLPGLLENTRVYNLGQNTLAQVGVQGTGAHAIRHGTVPFNPFQKNYYDIVNAQNVLDSSVSNRLVALAGLKMTSGLTEFTDIRTIPNRNLINTLGISLNRNLMFEYLGGPGSTYGIGSTVIKRAVDTTKLKSSRAMIYDELMIQNVNNTTDGARTTNIQDFRVQLGQATSWVKEDTLEYKLFYASGTDKMNTIYPFLFPNNIAPWEFDFYKDQTQDVIKFVFEAISNDQPNMSKAIFFRAFLTAGITDNNSAQLNSFKYMGRGENFYTYQGFDRSVGFSFRIAAFSKTELDFVYNKLELLMSQVYPDYSSKQGIMRAPVVRVTIGDYLYRVPGFIENVNITIDNNTPWETNLDGDTYQLPQVVDVAISFKPIMDTLPQRGGRLIGTRKIPSADETSVGLNVIGDEVATNNATTNNTITNSPLLSNITDPLSKLHAGLTSGTGTFINSVSANATSTNTAAPANGGPTNQQTKTAAAKKKPAKVSNQIPGDNSSIVRGQGVSNPYVLPAANQTDLPLNQLPAINYSKIKRAKLVNVGASDPSLYAQPKINPATGLPGIFP